MTKLVGKEPIQFHLDTNLVEEMDNLAHAFDMNRSQFIRAAIREKIAHMRIVSVSELPHPADAQSVPLIHVLEAAK